MTPDNLLSTLKAQGVTLTVEGENVRVKGTRSALSAETLEAIRAVKPELIKLLQPTDDAGSLKREAEALRREAANATEIITVERNPLPAQVKRELAYLKGTGHADKLATELRAQGVDETEIEAMKRTFYRNAANGMWRHNQEKLNGCEAVDDRTSY